jgi:peptidoglycan/LPS O-acetylase OafA/YrhL
MTTENYHPHINALRAFALVAVIIFHVNYSYLKNDFITVGNNNSLVFEAKEKSGVRFE